MGHRIGDLIRYYREKADMSQAELARKAEISQIQVSRIESNERGASIETLSAIANILAVEPKVLGGALLFYTQPSSDR